MRCDHLDAPFTQVVIQRIDVKSAMTDQIVRLGFDQIRVKAELNPAFTVEPCAFSAPSCGFRVYPLGATAPNRHCALEETHELAIGIDTVAVHGLKALDPDRSADWQIV